MVRILSCSLLLFRALARVHGDLVLNFWPLKVSECDCFTSSLSFISHTRTTDKPGETCVNVRREYGYIHGAFEMASRFGARLGRRTDSVTFLRGNSSVPLRRELEASMPPGAATAGLG